jgi:putative PIN family toxin of toxin-antitoxin system
VTRAVLDTNTLVSGLGWGGVPGRVVDAALAGRFEIVSSRALLEELRRVLHYPKLATVVGDPDEIVDLLALTSVMVEPTETVDVVRDPDDNRVVEVAIAGSADVIVTGDADLLDLRAVGSVRVLTATQFLAELDEQQ